MTMVVSRYQETSVVYRSSVLWLFSWISIVLVISGQNRGSETAVVALLLIGEWFSMDEFAAPVRCNTCANALSGRDDFMPF